MKNEVKVFSYSFTVIMLFGLLVVFTFTADSPGDLMPITGFALADGSTVTRSFSPASVAPGGSVTVTLTVIINGAQSYYGIEEHVPSGWTVSDYGTPSGQSPNPLVLKWANFDPNKNPLQGRTFVYTVSAPNTPGTYTYSGTYFIEETTDIIRPIEGSTQITVTSGCVDETCNGVDDDCDGQIDEIFGPEDCQYVCEANNFYWAGNGNRDPSLDCCGNDALEDDPFAYEFSGSPASLCDGNDNDCDGTKDEYFSVELCSFVCLSSDNGGQDFDINRMLGKRCCGDSPGEAYPFEDPERSCSDGRDNDCDNLVDLNDPNCGECQVASDCDDGVWCNGQEICTSNVCQTINIPQIDDGIACTVDSCDEVHRIVINLPDDSFCLNGKWCDGSETCNPTLGCLNGASPDCADSLPCSSDSCNEGVDQNDNMGDCIHDTSECQCYSDPECDDGNPCTDDSCITNTCQNIPDNTNNCNDGFFCTENDRCISGTCTGSQVSVDDSIDCTTDACDDTIDQIVNTPVDSQCNDNLFCNGLEYCDKNSGCKSGTPPVTDDGVDCTEDVCDEGNDLIINTPDNTFCWNGLWCDGPESCNAVLGCRSGTAKVCHDTLDCSVDSCSEGIYTDDNIGDCFFDTSGCSCFTDSECDDSNQCTDDKCISNQCVNSADNTNNCNDGFFCTKNDRCSSGECIGDAYIQDDYISCTDDACDEDNDKYVHKPDNGACGDGLYCNGVEYCDTVFGCRPGIPPDKDDGISCTVDSCDEDTDTLSHLPDSSKCQNGLWCDGTEVCSPAQGCTAGTARNCADYLDCTVDSCYEGLFLDDDIGECIHDTQVCTCFLDSECDDGNDCTDDKCVSNECENTPDDNNQCDDSFWCTNPDRCSQGSCIGTEKITTDGIDCTLDSCDEDLDRFIHIPEDSACDDGLFCDGAEYCDENNGCKHGTSPTVDDSISCTDDECDETNDVVIHNPSNTICQDGLWCNGFETCDKNAGCRSGTNVVCDDNIDCTFDQCSEGTHFHDNVGECTSNFAACSCNSDYECDDQNPCTDDTCDESRKCQNTPNDLNKCEDGFFCTINDRCSSGECITTPLDVDDHIPCTKDYCDEDNDIKVNTPQDSECNDGLYCNGVETCSQNSGCKEGTAPSTDDGIECTIDTCNEAVDLITHDADDTVCSNGRWCDGQETCDSDFGCLSGTSPNCQDSLDCTLDTCDEGSEIEDNIGECRHDTSNCPCNSADDCNDQNICTIDTCETDNKCRNTPDDGKACSDGLYCTVDDRCQDGSCVTKQRDVDDGIDCTSDICDEENDKEKHLTQDKECDDAKYCNGKEYCTASGCRSGQAPICNDKLSCTQDLCIEFFKTCLFKEIDADKDGYSICEGDYKDCNDNNKEINYDSLEICSNLIDDDCDTKKDSLDPDCFACTPGNARYCQKQEGVCDDSIENCTAEGNWPGCDEELYLEWNLSYVSKEQDCNDTLDNDCDGTVNENCEEENKTNTSQPCIPIWITGEWSICDSNSFKNRNVTDTNNCSKDDGRPTDTQMCIQVATCTDGLMNSEEEGVDCGGTCPVLCEEGEMEENNTDEPAVDTKIEIKTNNIEGFIFDDYEFSFFVSNNGERTLEGLTINLNKWVLEPVHLAQLLPGEKMKATFSFRLPEEPGEDSLDIHVLKDGKVIESKKVHVIVGVPDISFRVDRNEETGDLFSIFIADNRERDSRELSVDYSISKGKEIYLFDSDRHKLEKGVVYHKTEKIVGLGSLPDGKYEVESLILEDGDEIGESSSFFEIGEGKEGFNASIFFYMILILIISGSGYMFYTVWKRGE